MIPFAALIVVADKANAIGLAAEQAVFIRVRAAGKRFGKMPDDHLDNSSPVTSSRTIFFCRSFNLASMAGVITSATIAGVLIRS